MSGFELYAFLCMNIIADIIHFKLKASSFDKAFQGYNV